jgi:hypothetical protein
VIFEACIWCNGDASDSDVSHVVPECFGNRDQQCLPKGVVCRKCNNYFGSKIEPALIADPILHAICVATRIIDPGDGNVFRDRLFDEQHKPTGSVDRDLKIDATLSGQHYSVDIGYAIRGQIRVDHDGRREAKLSRALHKLAFESYVWQLISGALPASAPSPSSSYFEPIRSWTRHGQPSGAIRAYVRMPARALSVDWEMRTVQYEEHLASDMRLYGDCFAVSLTSQSKDAGVHLRSWCAALPSNAVLVGTSYELLREEEVSEATP